MDEDLEFCLLKFAEEQQLLHDKNRKEQEETYQNHLTEIRNKEQKILREEQMIIELFEEQLMANKEKLDDSKTKLKHEIIQQLQERVHSEEEYMKQTVHEQEKELALWVEGKQQERSNISDGNELLTFDQTFETEKKYKMKQLNDLREAKSKQLQIERESLNDNARELLQIISSSNSENNWLTNVQRWCDKKFQLEKSRDKTGSEMMSTENINISSRGFLSNDPIKLISSTILDTTTHKQKLIEEFKQKMEQIFRDKEIEFNKNIDEKIQQLNRQIVPGQPGLRLSGLFSYLKRRSIGSASGKPVPTPAAETVRQTTTNAQESITIASLEQAKRQHSEQLEQERKEIISELEAIDTDCIPDRIRQWLKKQSDKHQHRFEKYDQEYEENQAQHLADDQAQMIELICALNELAINSKSADEFKKKLKNEEERVVEKHLELKALRTQITVPVIVLQVDDPKVHKLRVCIRFNEDFDQWIKDADNKKLNLISSIQQQFNLPENAFEIIALEKGSIVVHAYVHPPHGENVFQRLLAGGIHDIGGHDTISVTLGELNLGVQQERMNQRYNRNYGNNPGDTRWTGSLDRGGRPYFCPKGWRRFGIKVANTHEEFDRRWGTWPIAYHGTASTNASAILATGLRVTTGCYATVPVVYLSPSINYCAHYRYAKPWRNPRKPGKYYQMILQCRVKPEVVTPDKIRPQTLRCPQEIRIDEHFTNNEVEWIIYPTHNEQYITDNIICYGIMIRVCDGDPKELPESEWWRHTPYRMNY